MAKPAASGPQAKPPKDPQPSVDRIEELARRVLHGDILLPKFQREFVWERQQILDLLDSVALNYPIGSILLWQSRQELRSENRIADLEIKLPKPDYPVNYLLDGQQRLSTICGALFWDGDNARSLWNIAYDLRAESFLHLDSLDDPPQHQIRLNKLADATAYFKHVSALDALQAPDKEVLKGNAERLFARFKDYKVAAVTLGDMPLNDVAPIFERINSTGTRLTIVDLMRAATWSKDFDLIDSIDATLDVLREKGFGELERKALLRNMSAAAGGDFSAESIDDLRDQDAEKLKAVSKDTEEAYRRAVDFLATQIRVPHLGVLPYVNQVVVLAEIFRRLPVPSAAQFEEIHRWFWRTGVSGYFSGWNTGMMAADLEAVANFCSGKAKAIEAPVSPPHASLWRARSFRTNNAHSKILALVLSFKGPVDIVSGQAVDIGQALAWPNSKEFHHFFPRDFLAGRGESYARINALGNFIILSSASNKWITNRAPSDYLKDLQAKHGEKLRGWLNSNLVSEAALGAALKDDYEGFLEIRSSDIHAAVMGLAGWPAK